MGYQSSKMLSDEWLTPPKLIKSLGEFDLDPCSPENRPWPTAKIHYTKLDNGLAQTWGTKNTRIWYNPPYGSETEKWLSKLATHGNGIALIFARTETKMFFEHVWNKADALLFIKGRLYFHRIDGIVAKHNSGAPSVLIAYGRKNINSLIECNIPGKLIILNN